MADFNPSLDDCADVIDFLEDHFDYGRELKVRVRESDGLCYIELEWTREEKPRAFELYPPEGWVLTDWWRSELSWHTAVYKVSSHES